MGGDDRSPPAPARLKGRLLTRLAVLIVRNAALVSFLCCIAGIASLLLLPVLAKSVYVDENALLPGSARATFTHKDAVNARKSALEIEKLVASSNDSQRDFREWLEHQFDALGADYYFHRFCPPSKSFSMLNFLSPSHSYAAGSSCSIDQQEHSPGTNAVAILRAPQGDGNEAIVLVTPYRLDNFTAEDAIAIGISLSLLDLLSRARWLAKDVVWLASDSAYEKYTGVAAWLSEYHESSQDRSSSSEGSFFKRAGSISAGFVLEFERGAGPRDKFLRIRAEGSNGQMPNMDVISIVNSIVSWRQQFQLRLDGVDEIKNWNWLGTLGYVFESVGKRSAELRKKFLSHGKASYTTAGDYVNGVSILSRSCWKQLLGIPTGSHGAFRDFQIDAITLQVTYPDLQHNIDFLTNYGRLIEGVLRSINNLLEKFHQSLFLYIMVSPFKFVSISTYIIPFALLLANFPIQAAALCSSAKASPIAWIQAVHVVVLVEFWSFSYALLPAIAPSYVPARAWWLLSVFTLFSIFITTRDPLAPASEDRHKPLKSLTLALTGIALGILSAVNFSVALAGALILVPVCLAAQPLSSSWRTLRDPKSAFVSRISAVLLPVLTLIPPLAMVTVLLRESARLWSWIELMWFWGSALYVSVAMVWVPCFIICLYILFW